MKCSSCKKDISGEHACIKVFIVDESTHETLIESIFFHRGDCADMVIKFLDKFIMEHSML